MRATILACFFLAPSLLPRPSFAVTPVLQQRQIAAAMVAGESLAHDGRAYQARRYVLFAEKNTLHIRKGEGPVEAILVGTPYERLKFASYLATFQGEPVSLRWACAIARQLNNVLQFIVFAHSDTRSDQEFLHRLSHGRLQIGNEVLTSGSPTIFGPALDYYQIDGIGRQFRWLGSVTFRFDLPHLHLDGNKGRLVAFSFTDSDGLLRRYQLELRRYP